MVRLTHITGSKQGQVENSPKAVIRLGRGADCDVRFDATIDRTVSTHHAEIRFDGEGYTLVDTNSSNGTLVNGMKVLQHKLRPGDVVFLGGEVGPQLRFDLVEDPYAAKGRAPAPRAAPKAASKTQDGPDEDVMNAAAQAVAKARAQRQATGGAGPSGQTMFIMLDAINQTVEKKKSDWKKWAAIGGGLAVLVIGVLVAVVLYQQSKLNGKVNEKKDYDQQIAKLEAEIQLMGSDDPNLPGKVAQLELLTGKAAKITDELESTERGRKAVATLDSGDFVDKELRKIMKEFEADTYNIPRNFKERVKYYLDDWEKKKSYKVVWERRKRYWPMIAQAFAEEQVPEVMAYVAWQESQFDPEICSWVGARGMWQFMPATGRRYNLRIDPAFDSCKPPANSYYCPCNGTDERTDPYKAAKAGARYLGDLLAEFGTESFMLAIASYNKGEGGMRQILRERKLRRRADRDFWHLYHLKLLPEETMEYVPRIIAAAIVGRNPDKFGLN